MVGPDRVSSMPHGRFGGVGFDTGFRGIAKSARPEAGSENRQHPWPRQVIVEPMNDAQCYTALAARDARFDGRFFTAVRTTGVFCRPVCPARTPKRENVEFFSSAAAAAARGYRPCLRCRPETAPGTPAWNGSAGQVDRALRAIADGALDEDGVDALAARLGISSRHLGRLFRREVGVPPGAVARTRRLLFAAQLLAETSLPVTRVAHASGFRSVRRFNEALRETYGRSPTDLRRQRRLVPAAEGRVALRLTARPPFAWEPLFAYLRTRAIAGVEEVGDAHYARTFDVDGVRGVLVVRPLPDAAGVSLELPAAATRALRPLVRRVRRLFDLDATPAPIAGHLGRDPELAPWLRAWPGLRVPGAFDRTELVVRAILGQQVTVAGATTLAARVADAHGVAIEEPGWPSLRRAFPGADRLRGVDFAGVGVPRARRRALCAAVRVCAEPAPADRTLEDVVARWTALPGIGPWTAQYIALRAERHPDAWPAGDLVLCRQLRLATAAEAERRAHAWRPWRAYAAVYCWQAVSASLDAARP